MNLKKYVELNHSNCANKINQTREQNIQNYPFSTETNHGFLTISTKWIISIYLK